MQTHVLIAGTFDGLHAGHRTLLTEAFRVGDRVTIGVTSDAFVAKFKSQTQKTIKSYQERTHNLEIWLRKQQLFERATIIPIDDPYEPAASMKNLDALIVTSETRERGEEINNLRQGLALSPLALIEVPMVPAEDGEPVSSTRLRNREIDPDGRLVMPEALRFTLSKPLGKILTGTQIDTSIVSNRYLPIITVGDMATKTILDAGVVPMLAIVDGKVGRKPFPHVVNRLQSKVSVKSGPGFISREADKAIEGGLFRAIIIDGEEDLLVLPAIMHAPLGSILYYGQPGKGLVEVVVTQKVKRIGAKLLHGFTELHSTVEIGRPEDDR